jgi:ketosteroid isomerase-like protein
MQPFGMTQEAQKAIIEDFITAYNRFDVDAMAKQVHTDVVFQNISNGEVTLETKGKAAFIQQAQEATTYFSERHQTPTAFRFAATEVEVSIAYYGTLAVPLPNGLKAGDVLQLNGRSVYTFQDALIIKLTDIS